MKNFLENIHGQLVESLGRNLNIISISSANAEISEFWINIGHIGPKVGQAEKLILSKL